MKNRGKKAFTIVITGVLAVFGCIGLLFVSSFLLQSFILKNAQASADYFKQNELFEEMISNQSAVKRDNYADCISFCIAWHLGNESGLGGADGSNALVRILRAGYTQELPENVNDGFYRAVYEGAPANVAYSRYWHGGAAFIRLFLPLTGVEGLRFGLLLTGILLNLAWVVYLIIRREYTMGIAYLLGCFAGKLFFGYLCLEYAFVCLFVPIFSFAVYRILEKEKKNKATMPLNALFLLSGILTCFFDFLTAETLTFTVPAFVMLVYLTKKKPALVSIKGELKDKERRMLWKRFLNSGLFWMMGYAGMFGLKWALSGIFLGKEELQTAASYALERSVGEVHLTQNMASPTLSFFDRIREVFVRNFSCLLGLSDSLSTPARIVILLGVAAGIGLLWFFLRKPKEKGKKEASSFPVFLALFFIPIVRFLVLSNHSYMHSFFTYRALMVSVMVLSFLFLRSTLLDRFLEAR